MKKIISLLALASFLIPNTTTASLWSYYNGNLPTIQERSITYSQFADDKYTGSAEQNIFLESKLKGGILGATTKIKLTDPNSVTPAATSTPTANMIPIASSSGKVDDNWIPKYDIFGDGRDGDVSISSVVTSTRDMFYNNLTISSSGVLNTNGYRIYVKGTLNNAGIIRRNGNNGGDGYGGANGSYAGCGGGGGGAGGNGGIIVLSAKTIINSSTASIEAKGGNGGNGAPGGQYTGTGAYYCHDTTNSGKGGTGGSAGADGLTGNAGVVYYKNI